MIQLLRTIVRQPALRAAVLTVLVLQAHAAGADVRRGAALLRDLNCVECHSLGGEGGRTAPDLGQERRYIQTPGAFMSALWNHTPAMLGEMSARTVPRPAASDEEWQDLFTYLAAFQIMASPANASRGGRTFDRYCAACHSTGKAPDKKTWRASTDPVALLEQMWRHSNGMLEEFQTGHRVWAKLSARDLSDLAAFVRHGRTDVADDQPFVLPSPAGGEAAFQSECGGCHTGAASLQNRLKEKSWMETGAALWNHAPAMKGRHDIPAGSMKPILAWIWELQHSDPSASVARGAEAFRTKKCIECHADANGAPMSPRPGASFGPFSMAAIGWGPTRLMHAKMQEKGIPWPRLSATDTVDLAAYLTSLKR